MSERPQWVPVGETTWPVDGTDESIEWYLRYGGELTREQRLTAASLIAAYKQICWPTQSVRDATAAMRRGREAHRIALGGSV